MGARCISEIGKKVTARTKLHWRCRGSNPGPHTCKACALPLSYIPSSRAVSFLCFPRSLLSQGTRGPVASLRPDSPEAANPRGQCREGFQGLLLNNYGGATSIGGRLEENRAGINAWRRRWKTKGKSFDALLQMNCEPKKKSKEDDMQDATFIKQKEGDL